jgi:hypothetical protein
MKKLKYSLLIGTTALGLGALTVSSPAMADQNAMANQQIAASVVDFLSNAMYPDSSDLATGEEKLLAQPLKADQAAKVANSNLALSSLASGVAVAGAPVVTKKGVQAGSSNSNVGKTFANDNMNSFLCGKDSSKCLYTPTHSNALVQTLMGSPYASNNGGLTAADTLLTKNEAESGKDLYDYSGNDTDSSKYSGSLNKSSYFNYNRVFGAHEPDSLEPAKYYGLFATKAYDVNLLNQDSAYKKLVRKAVKTGNIYSLRSNPTYQQHVMLARQLTAINSALMGNILWLAKQHTVSIKKDQSPTGKAMSQAEADDYIGNHRLNDNGVWVNKVKNESPTELLREQTLMMAEANHQRQENNVTMKRMLATMTILAAENKELYQFNAALQAKLKKSKGSLL